MPNAIHAYAAKGTDAKLEPFEFDPGPLGPDQIEMKVEYCGICHSDYSMLKNEWHMTRYPLVPGHEAIGTITAVGAHALNVKVGDRVGLGWNSASCLYCDPCRGGDQHMCVRLEQTIVGRHGAFADRVRCHWTWAVPLPKGLDAESAGPLFCGGITVFSPLLQFDVRPTQRIGVIGIGGLGHLALQFANKWGCEVTAFTSSDSKAEEAKKLGAHNVVNSRDTAQMKKLAGSLDFVLSTASADLSWGSFIETLRPRGKLCFVGIAPNPVPVQVFQLIAAQRAVVGSPSGNPLDVSRMLEFCVRHDVKPLIETFPMSKVNEAMARLESGKARYRVVLKSDW